MRDFRNTNGFALALALLCLLAAPMAADEPGAKKVSAALPVVVKTIPEAGAEAVDADLKEIQVTFSKKMQDNSWSWATDTSRGAILEPDGKVHFDKKLKTCIMPVKLKPDTTYAVWLNSENFQNFKDEEGNPALPYLLVFRTAKKD